MDTKEIMVNDEVLEATEEIATTGSSKGLKIAGIVGLSVIGGMIIYKYVVKPTMAMAKIRAKNKAVGESNVVEFIAETVDEDIKEAE